jgi:hypothetical protein
VGSFFYRVFDCFFAFKLEEEEEKKGVFGDERRDIEVKTRLGCAFL